MHGQHQNKSTFVFKNKSLKKILKKKRNGNENCNYLN